MDLLPLAEFAYNNRVNESIGMSPFFANQGYHPTIAPQITTVTKPSPPADEVTIKLIKNHEYMQENIRIAQDRYKEYYDKRRLPSPKYEVGDNVYISCLDQFTTGQPSRKLQPKRWGPTKITEILSPHTVRIALPESLSKN